MVPEDTVTYPVDSALKRRRVPSKTVASFAWLVSETIAARIIAFLGQLVLAYLLDREDFGLFTVTTLVRAVADLISTPGFRILLIQRHAEYDRLAPPVFWLSTILGLLCTIVIVIVTLFTNVVTSPTATKMILVVALSVPFRAISVLPEAALRIRLQFAEIALLGTLTAVLTVLISITFAYFGFGALSLVIPIPITAIIQLVIAWRLTSPPVTLSCDVYAYIQVVRNTIVLFASRVLTVVSANVDYFSLLLFHSKREVGIYFLAYNLSTQTIRLFSDTLVQVLMPTLAHTSDIERQYLTSVRATRAISLIVVPSCFLMAVLSEELVRLCFRPEYAGMVPILQLLCLGMAFRCVGAVSNALLNAQGRFGTVLWFDGLTTVIFGISVGLAAWLGTAVHVAAVVGGNVVVRMMFLQHASLKKSQIPFTMAVGSYLLPAILALLAAMLAKEAVRYLELWTTVDAIEALAAKTAVFGASYLALAAITMLDDVKATFVRLVSLWHGAMLKSHGKASD